MTIAKDNNIKKGKQIIEEVNSVVSNWKSFAKKAGVRKDLTYRIQQNLNLIH